MVHDYSLTLNDYVTILRRRAWLRAAAVQSVRQQLSDLCRRLRGIHRARAVEAHPLAVVDPGGVPGRNPAHRLSVVRIRTDVDHRGRGVLR